METQSPLTEITKPKDIFLGVTYPLQEADFVNDIRPQVNKEFAKLKMAEFEGNRDPGMIWRLRLQPTAQKLVRLCSFLQEKGGKALTNFSLSDFPAFASYKVIVPQAHYNDKEQAIELFDGKHSIGEVIAAIPEDFSGIFDLTICNSDYLANGIKKKFGDRCFVLQNMCPTTLQVRMPVYKAIFGILSVEDMNYSDADIFVRTTMINQLNKKNGKDKNCTEEL